jgi:hypothetical protein
LFGKTNEAQNAEDLKKQMVHLKAYAVFFHKF